MVSTKRAYIAAGLFNMYVPLVDARYYRVKVDLQSVTVYKPYGFPNRGEFLLPVIKQFLGKGND